MRLWICLAFVGLALASDLDGYYEDDMYIIEADSDNKADDLEATSRAKRQILLPTLVAEDSSSPPCQTQDGRNGLCRAFSDCYPYFKTFALGAQDSWVMGSFDACGLYSAAGREINGICCTKEPSAALLQAEKDKEKDLKEEEAEFDIEFSELNENCGSRHGLKRLGYIVNGVEATVNEYPFMAALLNKRKQFCGGSVIDEIHILTAAHCVAHMSKYDVQNLRVVLGDHNLKVSGETQRQVFTHSVRRVIRHKRFDNVKLYNDVAVLTLDKPITFTPSVQSICLDLDKRNKRVNEEVEVAGWGTTSSGASSSSDVLRKVDVRVWDNARCDSSYGSKAPGGIKNTMICANKRTKDSCAGDSGGPLFKCQGLGGCTQIGIVSWGIGCARANYPGVYTRVAELAPWIEKIVKKY